MRYIVYIEGFPYLDYSSTYQPHEFKVWACTTSFVYTCIYRITWCLITCLCVSILTTWFSMYAFLIQLYRCTCAYLCAPLGFILRTRWVAFWQPLDLHARILELGPWWIFRGDQCTTIAYWISNWSSVPLSFQPLSIGSQDSFCCSRALVVLFTLCKLYFCISCDVIFI